MSAPSPLPQAQTYKEFLSWITHIQIIDAAIEIFRRGPKRPKIDPSWKKLTAKGYTSGK